MKKINYVKFALDLIMAVLFVLFFNKNVLGGLAFHEMAGLFFAAAYFTHILLNVSWVKKVTMKLFDRSLSWKVRGGYGLNLLLLISMSFIIISGILVSHIVFPNINVSNENWFKMTHISVSFLVLALVGVHVGLHWQWVVQVFKKIVNVRESRAWIGYAAKALTLVILLFGVYEMNQTSFISHLKSSAAVIGVQSQPMGPGTGAGKERGAARPEGRPAGEAGAAEGKGFNSSRGNKGGGSANALGVVATYTGVMAVFVILTYYLKRLTERRRTKLSPDRSRA